jgi:hypothetical protein
MKRRILTIVFIGLIISSCCNETDENFGIIQNNLNIEGFGITSYHCLNLPDTCCIRNNNQFAELFKVIGTNPDCDKIILPEVDFTKYSLLINHKENSGKKFYHKTVSVDSANKIVTYLITYESCPIFVDSRTESYNIVIVPRIGDEYRIEYK